MSWILIFIMVALFLVWIYYAITYVVDHVLDERGFQSRNDFLQDSADNPTFTYCLKASVCEAFSVGSEYLPNWAKRSDMEIVVSPEPKVLLHTNDGTRIVPKGMYVVLFEDGQVGIASENEMKQNFIKINPEEDQM